MNKIMIQIDTDYKDYTDEMEELTRELQEAIEENDELDIEEVKIPTKPAEKGSKSGLELVEFGKLLVVATISPEVISTLVGIVNSWIKDKVEINSISKSVTVDYENKKCTIDGHNADDAIKILQAVNMGD